MPGSDRRQDASEHGVRRRRTETHRSTVRGLVRNWKTLLLTTLIGLACGLALYARAPLQWSANLQVQIGRFPAETVDREIRGALGRAAKTAVLPRGSTPVETNLQVATRISGTEFVDKVVAAVERGGQGNARDAQLFRATVKTWEMRDTDFVEVAFLGYSPEALQEYSKQISAQIKQIHNTLIDEVAAETRRASERKAAELSVAQTDYTVLRESYNRIAQLPADQQLLQLPLFTSQILASSEQLRYLRDEMDAYAWRLNPVNLVHTSVSAPRISDGPVAPRLRLYAVLGLVAGFVVGCLILLIRRKIVFKLVV